MDTIVPPLSDELRQDAKMSATKGCQKQINKGSLAGKKVSKAQWTRHLAEKDFLKYID